MGQSKSLAKNISNCNFPVHKLKGKALKAFALTITILNSKLDCLLCVNLLVFLRGRYVLKRSVIFLPDTRKLRTITQDICYVQATYIEFAMTIFGQCHNVLNNKLRYLSADIICSENRTVFREQSSRKTVSFEEQVMSKEKYPSIFLKSNGGYCVSYLSNIFRNKRDLPVCHM